MFWHILIKNNDFRKMHDEFWKLPEVKNKQIILKFHNFCNFRLISRQKSTPKALIKGWRTFTSGTFVSIEYVKTNCALNVFDGKNRVYIAFSCPPSVLLMCNYLFFVSVRGIHSCQRT